MDSTRFDRISRIFAARRLSRRQAMLQGAAGLTAAGLAAAGLSAAAAQDGTPAGDASPVASIETSRPEFLFVQSFESGSIAPREGADDGFTVTLRHGLGQTLYFSDRPERIVGATPTPQFLDGLGFFPDNPPNAALVVDTGAGGVDIAVVELTNPTYDESSHTATYDISVLQNYSGGGEMQFQEATADLGAVAASFGSSHLFIDDCADTNVRCVGPTLIDENGNIVERWQDQGLQPMCWSWDTWLCQPCFAATLIQTCWDVQVCVEGYPCRIEVRT